MPKYRHKKILRLSVQAGEIMQRSGAETYRVEETITRVARAAGINDVETFATTTGIFASVDPGEDVDDVFTLVKRVPFIERNMEKISEINSFSREFATTDLTIDEGLARLREIDAIPKYPLWLRFIGSFLVGLCMSPSYGAHPYEMIFAGIIAGLAHLLSDLLDNLRFTDFIRVFTCCSGITLLAVGLKLIIPQIAMSPIIVGAFAIFMPGITITNAARDLISAETLSGVQRLTEALLYAIAIAGGVGVVLKVWSLGGGTLLPRDAVADPVWLQTIYAFIYTFGFSLLFRIPKRHIITCAVFGAIAMLTCALFTLQGYSLMTSVFFGTLVLSFLAEIGARVAKDATSIFLIPGIIPFVPGSLIYATMTALIGGNYEASAYQASQAGGVAGAIAIALVISASIMRLIMTARRRFRWMQASKHSAKSRAKKALRAMTKSRGWKKS
ncbi:MAG: threonine/serine exporter family protein [Clostridiales Family XIII bacterium]|jgi:uncharacterized membrane protein YjjP (DUF1212 family)|nr:threonine/serine exporter family protein [Clostridiales Family XIII bacterium]